MMNIERVPASHGWLWITHGYRLIMRSPLHVLALALLGALGVYLAMLVPKVGALLAVVIMPLLLAGYMRVCRALEFHQKVEISYLFQGFEQRTPQLLALGGLLLAGMILISIVITVIGGSALTELLDGMRAGDDPNALLEAMLNAGSSVALSLIIGLALLFLLMLAFQFAPMLVFFDQLAPFAALQTSLSAILRNIIPFVLCSLILQGIAFIAALIPYDLGWMLMLPLGLTSMYVGYRDIFPTPVAMDASMQAHDAEQPPVE
ncbi:MAG TPA: BPSS1780 family membrane protein [Gallionellaceae bacterium]|nr:BPSS1780 family membrane protein [Gallionellaceae bacterium]